MANVSLILRIVIMVLCAVAVILPFAWTKCILAPSLLTSMGLAIVGLTVAVSLVVIDSGEQLHCEIIEGLMGCLLVICGLVQVLHNKSDCNGIGFLVIALIAGVLFITDMILLILGKSGN